MMISIYFLLLVPVVSSSIVTLLSGQYCSTDGGGGTHANPGDIISINCAVDNDDGLINILTWTISSVEFNNIDGEDATDGDFVSTVNSFNDTLSTTNATLIFPAISDMDETVVICRGAQSDITSNCTLLIKTVPSPPEQLPSDCTDITYQSLILQWNPPSDDGGEPVQYNITGTPDDISITTDNTMMDISNLTPNTEYNFSVRANNSVGFGDELVLSCTTLGNVPTGFTEVSVCLDVNMDFDTVLDIEYFPCPIIIDPVTTPPVDNYTVTVINNSAINIISILSENIATDTCDYNIPVNEDNIYTIEMSVNNIIGSSEKTTADHFIASWLKDVQVKDVTDASATIHYTTADCVVDELDNLKIDLRISGCSIIDPSSPVLYKNATDGNFSLSELQPNDVLTYTLQVITEAMGSTVTIGRIHTGSITVSPIPSVTIRAHTGSITVSPIPSSTTTLVTIRATSSVNIVASTCTPCDSSPEGLSAPVSAGITLAISVPVSSIISSLLTLLVVYLCYGKRKGNYSINTTGPVYDTPLPGSNVTRTSKLQMKGNQAYGHVTSALTRTSEFQMKGNQAYGHVTSAPRSTSEYEIV